MKITVISFFWGLAAGVVISNGLILLQQKDDERKKEIDSLVIPKSTDNTNTRGYNFNAKRVGNYYNYTDEEIRMIREKVDLESNGTQYLKTPGRYVPSHEQMIE